MKNLQQIRIRRFTSKGSTKSTLKEPLCPKCNSETKPLLNNKAKCRKCGYEVSLEKRLRKRNHIMIIITII